MKRAIINFDDPATRREWLRRLQISVKNRAQNAGMDFTLCREYAAKLYDDQEGCCAVSGIKFHLESYPKVLVKHPFAPSIDRILSDGRGPKTGTYQWGRKVSAKRQGRRGKQP
jgi:hypothetical protein